MHGVSPRVQIWHNPACSKSRQTLALIRQAGIEPLAVDYLQNPPDKSTLRNAIAAAGVHVREAIRASEAAYLALGLGTATPDPDVLLDAMVADPRLIERPFVFTPLGVRLCRPPELVLDILPRPATSDASEEDGERAAGIHEQRIR